MGLEGKEELGLDEVLDELLLKTNVEYLLTFPLQ